MKSESSIIEKELRLAIYQYFTGKISRRELASVARQNLGQSELEKGLAEWSVKQTKDEFLKTRTLLVELYQKVDFEYYTDLQDEVDKYLEKVNFPEEPTEEDVKILVKKLIGEYLEDEISETLQMEIVTRIMHSYPKASFAEYEFQDKILLGILITIDDSDMLLSSHYYIENELAEYYRYGRGFAVVDATKDYYEKNILPNKKNK